MMLTVLTWPARPMSISRSAKASIFCAGAHLARLELRLMLSDLLRRIDQIELAGKIERLKSNLIAGIKHMPVRFTQARVAA